MLTMNEIKQALKNAFAQHGYTASVAKFIQFKFEISYGIGNAKGGFNISSANAKRFELKVLSKDKNDLPGNARPTRTGDYYVAKRFTKRADAIAKAMLWLSEANTKWGHLRESLDINGEPVDAIGFQEGRWVANSSGTVWPGHAESVAVGGIVSVQGREVTEAVYEPGIHPYFIAVARIRPKPGSSGFVTSLEFITDGEMFWPVRSFYVGDKSHIRICMFPAVAERLGNMNQADKELVHMACRLYTEKLQSDTPST